MGEGGLPTYLLIIILTVVGFVFSIAWLIIVKVMLAAF